MEELEVIITETSLQIKLEYSRGDGKVVDLRGDKMTRFGEFLTRPYPNGSGFFSTGLIWICQTKTRIRLSSGLGKINPLTRPARA